MAISRSNSSKSLGRTCRAAPSSEIPRRRAASVERRSGAWPRCQSPIPALSTSTPSTPSSRRSARITPSAVGERQMLPMQTKRMRVGSMAESRAGSERVYRTPLSDAYHPLRGCITSAARMSEIGENQLHVILSALGEQLAQGGERVHLVVIGGSALIAIDAIGRATRDVDVVALEVDGVLISAQPLPEAVVSAAAI